MVFSEKYICNKKIYFHVHNGKINFFIFCYEKMNKTSEIYEFANTLGIPVRYIYVDEKGKYKSSFDLIAQGVPFEDISQKIAINKRQFGFIQKYLGIESKTKSKKNTSSRNISSKSKTQRNDQEDEEEEEIISSRRKTRRNKNDEEMIYSKRSKTGRDDDEEDEGEMISRSKTRRNKNNDEEEEEDIRKQEIENNEYKKWITRYNQMITEDEKIFEKIKKNRKILDTVKNPIHYYDLNIETTIKLFEIEFLITNSDGLDIFDKAISTENIPFIQYNNKNNISYYKIFNEINEQSIPTELETNKPDTMYFTISIGTSNTKKNNIFCQFSIKDKKLEIKYEKIHEEFILDNILHSFPTIKLNKSKEVKLSGSVILDKLSVVEHSLYYLILTEDIFNTYLYVNESKTEESKITHLNINYKTFVETDTLTSPVKVYFKNDLIFTPSSIELNIVHAESHSILIEFLDIFSKLLGIYMQKLNDTNEMFDYYLPNLTNNNVEIVTSVVEGPINTTKNNNLKERLPEFFAKGTARTGCQCNKQPIVIYDNEIADWENYLTNEGNKRPVLKLKLENRTVNVVCPENEFPNITVSDKKDGLPCCGKKYYVIEDMEKVKKPEKDEEKSKITDTKYRLLTTKILDINHPNGSLNTSLVKFLQITNENDDFIRTYIPISKVSFIHCVMLAIGDEAYLDYDDELREKYCQKLRKKLSNNININVYKQEMYDYSEEDIRHLILDTNTYFDPYLFYRGIEEMFNVNIFVFNFNTPLHPIKDINDINSNMPVMEIPRAKLCHIRKINTNRKSILILKHFGSADSKLTHPHCELIISRGSILEGNENKNYGKSKEVSTYGSYIFGTKMTTQLFNYLNKNIHTFSYENNIVRDSPFSIIDWENIFPIGEVISQKIDAYGKTVSLELKVDEFSVEIMIPSTQPLNLPTMGETNPPDREKIIELLGSSKNEDEEGLWYPILDYVKGICVKYKKEEKIYINEVDNYKSLKEDTHIFMQIINWLWKLTIKETGVLMQFKKFWKKYYVPNNDDNKMSFKKEIGRILPEVNNVEEGLIEISKYWDRYFKEDGIYLYDTLSDHVYRFFLREENLIKDLPLDNFYMQIPLRLEYIYPNFYLAAGNLLFITKSQYKNWLIQKNRGEMNVIINILDNELTKKRDPIIYKDIKNGKIYLIQNVNIGDMKRKSLFLCKKWNEENINEGFNTHGRVDIKKISYVTYNLSKIGTIIPTESEIYENEPVLQILNWGEDMKIYSALLPIL